MRRPKSHFSDNQQIRSGIFYLLLVLLFYQLVFSIYKKAIYVRSSRTYGIDSLQQAYIDSLGESIQNTSRNNSLAPFNPNYINDYRGYVLGLAPEVLDSLYRYIGKGGRIYDMKTFRRVSGLPDSVIAELKPYLKFPEKWRFPRLRTPPGKARTTDLNKATATDLKRVRGIGEVLSQRIIRFRESLGGFTKDSQVYKVYGLKPEVAGRLLRSFSLKKPDNKTDTLLKTSMSQKEPFPLPLPD